MTEQEAVLVKDLLDWWVEGFNEAKNETISDQTISDVDTLLDLVGSLEEDHQVAIQLREKVTYELERRSAAGNVPPL